MWQFWASVSAIYFYHKNTGRMIGEDNSHGKFPAPLADVNKAVDVTILHGGKESSLTSLRVQAPNGTESFDVRSGRNRKGLDFIFFRSHNGSAQILELHQLYDGSLIFSYMNMCMLYNDKNNNFETGDCGDSRIDKSKVDLYYAKMEPIDANPPNYRIREVREFKPVRRYEPFDEENMIEPSRESVYGPTPEMIAEGKQRKLYLDLPNNRAVFSTPYNKTGQGFDIRIGREVVRTQKPIRKGYKRAPYDGYSKDGRRVRCRHHSHRSRRGYPADSSEYLGRSPRSGTSESSDAHHSHHHRRNPYDDRMGGLRRI